MKPITLHPLSVLAGLVLAGGLLVLASAAQSPGRLQNIPTHDVRVVGQIPAEDWVFARLHILNNGGTITINETFTVPSDKYFVVTAVSSSYYNLLVNGILDPYTSDGLTAVSLSPSDNHGTRFVFQPGTALSLPNPGPGSQMQVNLWGYLESVN